MNLNPPLLSLALGTALAADKKTNIVGIWTRFGAIRLWLMVLLFVYCTRSELVAT